MVIITGWIAVQRNVLIDFNPEQYSLEIKTDSTLGTYDGVNLLFYTSQGLSVGRLHLDFRSISSTPTYYIGRCSTADTNYAANLPPGNDKVWRIALTRNSGIRLVVHCNEVEVINTMISDSTCGDSDWSTTWSKEIAKIKFSPYDTASDYYQTQPGSFVF